MSSDELGLEAQVASMAEQCRRVLVAAVGERDAARKTLDDLTRLAIWWRACKGGEEFKQALDFCANQLEAAIRGDLPGLSVLERWTSDGQRSPSSCLGCLSDSQPHTCGFENCDEYGYLLEDSGGWLA